MTFEKIRKRRGQFQFEENLMRYVPETVMIVMGRCLITHCDFFYDSNLFVYRAYSPDFEELDDSLVAPFYQWVITHAADGSIEVTCSRVKNS